MEGLEQKIERICRGFDGLIGAINARNAGNVNQALQITRLETKMDGVEKSLASLGQSQRNTNKVLIGMAVSLILAVLGAMLRGAVLR
ncbi:hypothetical protein [Pyramidobacter sp. CG50-2]|uniref:hypothetical protein n=1 Tax=Pyramidobacter sp. CG50-2 TaxID=2382160 RepID=UPI000EA3FEB0|nr:hypothetical protein [Pyramidobacter sp. CG50-2]RKJ80530.1 hypothetical protein D7D26_02870 [Pyramidobacter sp. CG50-2]